MHHGSRESAENRAENGEVNNAMKTSTRATTVEKLRAAEGEDRDDSRHFPAPYDDEGSEVEGSQEEEEEPSVDHEQSVKEAICCLASSFVLLIASIAAVSATYTVLLREHERDVRDRFERYAGRVIRASETRVAASLGDLRRLGTAATAFAETANLTWPRVSLSAFERRVRDLPSNNGGGGAQATAAAAGGVAEWIVLAPLVSQDERTLWVNYSITHQGWIWQGLEVQGRGGKDPGRIPEYVYSLGATAGSGGGDDGDRRDRVAPLWQMAPAPMDASIVNLDLLSYPEVSRMLESSLRSRKGTISKIRQQPMLSSGVFATNENKIPRSYVLQPIFEAFVPESDIVGFLLGALSWERLFRDVLPQGVDRLYVQVGDSCGSTFTVAIDGPTSHMIPVPGGEIGSSHNDNEGEYSDRIGLKSELGSGGGSLTDPQDWLDLSSYLYCNYTVDVYPSERFLSNYETREPLVYSCAAAAVLLFILILFCLCSPIPRFKDLWEKIKASLSGCSSCVAETKDCELGVVDDAGGRGKEHSERSDKMEQSCSSGYTQALMRKESISLGSRGTGQESGSELPVADLFPNATLMIATIVGFTTWSSAREPSHVFTLIDRVHQTFDKLAQQGGVVTIDTLKDCYVVVAGVPPSDERDHAIAILQHSRDCLFTFRRLMDELKPELGPDTSQLHIRIGVSSGPVVAGVLRGDQSRYRLFGDTVDAAARIERFGEAERIHVSQSTVDLLVASRKEHLVIPRPDSGLDWQINEARTYWLDIRADPALDKDDVNVGLRDPSESRCTDRSTRHMSIMVGGQTEAKIERLVEWNIELLLKGLKRVATYRFAGGTQPDPASHIKMLEQRWTEKGLDTLGEAEDIILPTFDIEITGKYKSAGIVDVGETVERELRDYVQSLSGLYRSSNSFHNFLHASQATMFAYKLVTRAGATNECDEDGDTEISNTFGIGWDPLIQFALLFAGLIQGIQHPGASNDQLVRETKKGSKSTRKRKRFIVQKNALHVGWQLLMQEKYENLRRQIYATATEFTRFRQVVQNSVLATDIFGKDRNSSHRQRWNEAFSEEGHHHGTRLNQKATLVIESIAQASYASHAMLPWYVYSKWNQRLYDEMYAGFLEGRSEKHPSETWFRDEIDFFDFYILPLAMRLYNCGVLGASGYEYVRVAQQNRRKWELEGQRLVQAMVERERTVSKGGQGDAFLFNSCAVNDEDLWERSIRDDLHDLLENDFDVSEVG